MDPAIWRNLPPDVVRQILEYTPGNIRLAFDIISRHPQRLVLPHLELPIFRQDWYETDSHEDEKWIYWKRTVKWDPVNKIMLDIQHFSDSFDGITEGFKLFKSFQCYFFCRNPGDRDLVTVTAKVTAVNDQDINMHPYEFPLRLSEMKEFTSVDTRFPAHAMTTRSRST